jgi:hypothetical protein
MISNKAVKQKQDRPTGSKIRKVSIKKWLFRFVLSIILVVGLLIAAVLCPGLFYKHKTTIGTFTIYHSDTLDAAFPVRLQEAVGLVANSEVYSPTFSMDLCLGESFYPNIIKHFFGNAFAWGFYNKVVIKGKMDFKTNIHQSNWNLSQLLAHEMTHCLQFDKFGLLHSNPLARYPEWKWEGYPEYVARQKIDEPLEQNIARLLKVEQQGSAGSISLPDGTQTNLGYYQHWLLVKFWMQTRKMSYHQLLKDTASEQSIRKEMMKLYQENQ